MLDLSNSFMSWAAKWYNEENVTGSSILCLSGTKIKQFLKIYWFFGKERMNFSYDGSVDLHKIKYSISL